MPGWPTRICCSVRTGSRRCTEAQGRRPSRRSRSTRSLAEAHVALGHIKLLARLGLAGRRARVQAGHLRSTESSALAHNQYAMYLATLGRVPDAIAEVRRAQDLDPLSPIVNSDLGWYLLYAGQVHEAIAQFRKTLEFDANSVSAHRGLGIALQRERAARRGDRPSSSGRCRSSENSPVDPGPPRRGVRARRRTAPTPTAC